MKIQLIVGVSLAAVSTFTLSQAFPAQGQSKGTKLLARGNDDHSGTLEVTGDRRMTVTIKTIRGQPSAMKGTSVSNLSDREPLTHYLPKGVSLDFLDRLTIHSKKDRWNFPNLSKKFLLFNPNISPEVLPGFARSADGSKVSIVFRCADAGLACVCGLLVTKSKVKPVFFAWEDSPMDARAIADRIIKKGR